MKKILVLSGKGGTGKTTVAAALVGFSKTRAFADCDVDAPNLHLLHEFAKEPEVKEFIGSKKATIQSKKCTFCGICRSHCRFGAISAEKGRYRVDEYRCEGCGVCQLVCPQGAIELEDDVAGKTMLYQDERVFSTAELKMGRGNSGKLVTQVKKNLFSNIDMEETAIAVVDGSPGIGCPVIASSGGMDLALIVAEPSLSGISDMERIVKVLKGFGVATMVCVNKADLSREKTEQIRKWCQGENLEWIGEIPYDKTVISGVNQGKSVAEIPSLARDALYAIYQRVMERLEVEV